MLPQLDPVIQRSQKAGQPNDYTRLMWGAEHGFLVAYPQELKLYNERQKFIVLLGDFYYVTQRFDQAADLFQKLLDNKFGGLADAQREYPNYAIGLCLCRTVRSQGSMIQAVRQFETVLKNPTGSWTQQRAALAIGQYGSSCRDKAAQDRATECFQLLAYSKEENEFTHQARNAIALRLLVLGKTQEGVAMLQAIPQGDKPAYEAAQDLLRQLRDPQSSLRSVMSRAATPRSASSQPQQ
jgi:tetratricopeptide (TPR) repeat protein